MNNNNRSFEEIFNEFLKKNTEIEKERENNNKSKERVRNRRRNLRKERRRTEELYKLNKYPPLTIEKESGYHRFYNSAYNNYVKFATNKKVRTEICANGGYYKKLFK